MMRLFFYTVAATAVFKELSRRLQPADTFILDESRLGAAAHFHRAPNRAGRARIGEFVEIHDYDAVVCAEADVQFPADIQVSPVRIQVEKGTSDVHKNMPDEPFPYLGCAFVSVPKRFYDTFFPAWAEAYTRFEVTHKCDERVLREALNATSIPWEFRQDNTFWPDQTGAIVHYQGIRAKRSLIPDITQRLASEFSQFVKTKDKLCLV